MKEIMISIILPVYNIDKYLEECLETKIENDEASKTVEEMKNNIFNSLGENFIQDTNNINNGYPVLTWQKGMMTIQ